MKPPLLINTRIMRRMMTEQIMLGEANIRLTFYESMALRRLKTRERKDPAWQLRLRVWMWGKNTIQSFNAVNQ